MTLVGPIVIGQSMHCTILYTPGVSCSDGDGGALMAVQQWYTPFRCLMFKKEKDEIGYKEGVVWGGREAESTPPRSSAHCMYDAVVVASSD